MEPIFNFFARTVGWLEDGIVFSDKGHPVAFLASGAVFAAKNGHYLGQYEDGVFHDRLGGIVACYVIAVGYVIAVEVAKAIFYRNAAF